MPDDCEKIEANEDGWTDWMHPLPGYLMQCCGCGLTHQIEYAIVDAGIIEDFAGSELNRGEGEKAIIFRVKAV